MWAEYAMNQCGRSTAYCGGKVSSASFGPPPPPSLKAMLLLAIIHPLGIQSSAHFSSCGRLKGRLEADTKSHT
jgi:hypothetical protein